MRGFETLTQWLNPVGSNLTLQWFSSAHTTSSDFSNVLYAPSSSSAWTTVKPWQERKQHFTDTHAHTQPYTRVHTNSWSRTQMLYISAFSDELCLYKADRTLPVSQILPQTLHWQLSSSRRNNCNFSFQKCRPNVLEKICFNCWVKLLLPITQIKRLGFMQPCNLPCYTHVKLYLWLHTAGLFRGRHIFSVSKMTAPYNKIKLIRLQVVKH